MIGEMYRMILIIVWVPFMGHRNPDNNLESSCILERIWKEAVMAYSEYYPGICLEGLRKTIEILN
jgi:hypothetical protein